MQGYQKQAFEILTSGRMAEAMNLEREDPRVRERYGASRPTTSSFGGAPKDPQKLLLARRLVEAGARCVTVSFGAWDWHGNRGGSVAQLAREDFPDFDHALATLYHHLGIDVAKATVDDHSGRPRFLVDENRRPMPELV